ncbi:MAG TPA: SirA family protein [Synergistaceae bacterium]|jgi:TusA-related sulfurtransferase|nr:SirA family protein [Synergistaceae bacterium]
MTDTVRVDARGLSCPQPVMETRRALEGAKGGRVEVLVDTVTSRENVARFGQSRGWTVEKAERDGGYCVILTK